MLGGLYGSLPKAKEADGGAGVDGVAPNNGATGLGAGGGWSAGAKALMQPVMRKPTPSASLGAPAAVLRAQKAAKPMPSPVSKPAAAPYDTWGLGDAASAAPVVSNTTGGSMSAELQEEYDPARPNDYEQYQQLQREETKRAEEEAARRRQEEALAQMPLPGPPPLPPSQQTEPQGGLPPPPPLPGGGAGGGGQKCAPAEGQATTTRERLTAAQRMMAKMGWSDGMGLGKNNQGMNTPLMAKKTDTHSAVIVNAAQKELLPAAKKPRTNFGSAFAGKPTRVLLLRNMVGPGEVDDDLEEEVAEECTKYGEVVRVMIFEVTLPNWPAQEVVRIFVEFTRSESAMKGLIDLDGRFFGGRTVHASFFDEDRFAQTQLAPHDDEERL